eukprot:scaffold3624_cov321-Pinguiococcus_pyrenoidosus.AAC.2
MDEIFYWAPGAAASIRFPFFGLFRENLSTQYLLGWWIPNEGIEEGLVWDSGRSVVESKQGLTRVVATSAKLWPDSSGRAEKGPNPIKKTIHWLGFFSGLIWRAHRVLCPRALSEAVATCMLRKNGTISCINESGGLPKEKRIAPCPVCSCHPPRSSIANSTSFSLRGRKAS